MTCLLCQGFHYIIEMNTVSTKLPAAFLAHPLAHVGEMKDTTTGLLGIKIDLDAC